MNDVLFVFQKEAEDRKRKLADAEEKQRFKEEAKDLVIYNTSYTTGQFKVYATQLG